MLKLVDNPKSNSILTQHSTSKARRPNESIRIGYTVHIRTIGDDSEEDTNVNFPSSPPVHKPRRRRPAHQALQTSKTEVAKLGKSSNEENNTSSSEDSNSADENRPVLK